MMGIFNFCDQVHHENHNNHDDGDDHHPKRVTMMMMMMMMIASKWGMRSRQVCGSGGNEGCSL